MPLCYNENQKTFSVNDFIELGACAFRSQILLWKSGGCIRLMVIPNLNRLNCDTFERHERAMKSRLKHEPFHIPICDKELIYKLLSYLSLTSREPV